MLLIFTSKIHTCGPENFALSDFFLSNIDF